MNTTKLVHLLFHYPAFVLYALFLARLSLSILFLGIIPLVSLIVLRSTLLSALSIFIGISITDVLFRATTYEVVLTLYSSDVDLRRIFTEYYSRLATKKY